MSEFSSGVLFLKKYIDMVQEATKGLAEPFLLRDLNAAWSGFYAESSHFERPENPWLLELSKRVPLLILSVTSDHGWGYDVLNDGVNTASLWVHYELQDSMAQDLAEVRYPKYKNDIVDAMMTGKVPYIPLLNEVAASEEYRLAVSAQFETRNTAAFAAFDITPEIIAELDTILTGDWYLAWEKGGDYENSQVDMFKQKLGIVEFEWMGYRYLSRNDEDD